MKNSDLNKMLGIGPGGINCGCCVDFPKKRKNHKKMYRRLKRKVASRVFRKYVLENCELSTNQTKGGEG
jgi:hypothetical protein